MPAEERDGIVSAFRDCSDNDGAITACGIGIGKSAHIQARFPGSLTGRSSSPEFSFNALGFAPEIPDA